MMKGKKKWLTALVAALLAAVEVLAPMATPLAELVADIVDPLPSGEHQLVDPLGLAPLPANSGS